MKDFEIHDELCVDVEPQVLFDAVTTGTAGWLWPLDLEPRERGASAFGGVVTAWEPPTHYANRAEGPDGWFNVLDFQISATPEGAFLRYLHAGVLGEDDWDHQYDGASKHTAFYLATLKGYVEHLGGKPVDYVTTQAPAASNEPGSFATVVSGLGDGAVGETVHVEVPGVPAFDAVVDYRTELFYGLLGPGFLLRVFGRETFGEGTVVTLHDATGEATGRQSAWQEWLDSRFA